MLSAALCCSHDRNSQFSSSCSSESCRILDRSVSISGTVIFFRFGVFHFQPREPVVDSCTGTAQVIVSGLARRQLGFSNRSEPASGTQHFGTRPEPSVAGLDDPGKCRSPVTIYSRPFQ